MASPDDFLRWSLSSRDVEPVAGLVTAPGIDPDLLIHSLGERLAPVTLSRPWFLPSYATVPDVAARPDDLLGPLALDARLSLEGCAAIYLTWARPRLTPGAFAGPALAASFGADAVEAVAPEVELAGYRLMLAAFLGSLAGYEAAWDWLRVLLLRGPLNRQLSIMGFAAAAGSLPPAVEGFDEEAVPSRRQVLAAAGFTGWETLVPSPELLFQAVDGLRPESTI